MIPARQAILLSGVLAASALCGAWFAGRTPIRPSPPAVVNHDAAKPTKSAQRSGGGNAIPAAVSKRLEEVRRVGDIQDKLRATIQLAQSLPISELEGWFEGKWFDDKDDILSEVFHEIALSRWLAADPGGLMRYCHRSGNSRGDTVAWRWALRDPQAALAYLGELEAPELRNKTASVMSMALATYQPEVAITEMPLLLSTLKTYELWAMMGKLAATSPAALKAAAGAWPPYVQEGIARELATVGLKRDLAGTIEELRKTEGGQGIFLNAFPFHSEALAELIRNPGMLPPGWFGDIAMAADSLLVKDDPERWLTADLAAMGLNPNQAKQVRENAIKEIGTKDQQRFLSLLEEAGLEGFFRTYMIRSAVERMAEDRAKTEAWIAGLPSDADKEAARQALALRRDEPEGEAVTPGSLLDGLAKDGGTLTAEQARATGIWSAPELQEAASRFHSLPVEERTLAGRHLLSHPHENFPPELQAQAISFFTSDRAIDPGLSDPFLGKRSLTQAACNLATSWAKEDPAAAGKWISSLPEGEERLWAAKNLSSLWAEEDPSAAKEWIHRQPEQDRKALEDYLKSGETVSH